MPQVIKILSYFIQAFIENIGKVWKKKGEDTILRSELTFADLPIDNLYKMNQDPQMRAKTEGKPPKVQKVLDKTKNSDVIYAEAELPFPLSNREFLYKRFYAGNKDSPDLIKQLGLYNWDHKYYILLGESIERSDFPITSKLVRAEIKMYYTLIEQDPNDSRLVRITTLSCMKLGGNLPDSMAERGVQTIEKLLERTPKNHQKFFG